MRWTGTGKGMLPDHLYTMHKACLQTHDEVERYLRTVQTDPYQVAWPGDVMEKGRRAHADLRT